MDKAHLAAAKERNCRYANSVRFAGHVHLTAPNSFGCKKYNSIFFERMIGHSLCARNLTEMTQDD